VEARYCARRFVCLSGRSWHVSPSNSLQYGFMGSAPHSTPRHFLDGCIYHSYRSTTVEQWISSSAVLFTLHRIDVVQAGERAMYRQRTKDYEIDTNDTQGHHHHCSIEAVRRRTKVRAKVYSTRCAIQASRPSLVPSFLSTAAHCLHRKIRVVY